MTKLVGLAVLFAFAAACGGGDGPLGCELTDECPFRDDPCFIPLCDAGLCVEVPSGDPACEEPFDGDLSGEIFVADEDDDASFGAYYDDRAEAAAYIGELAEQLNELPINGCVDRVSSVLPPSPGGEKPMGTIVLIGPDGEVLSLQPDAGNGYRGNFDPALFTGALDVEIAGAGAVEAQTLDGVLVPLGAPIALTDPVIDGRLELRETINYGPFDAGLGILTFGTFDENNAFVTTDCRLDPAGGALVLDPAYYDLLGESSSIDIREYNRRTAELATSDGVRRALFVTVRRSSSQPYSKPPK